MLTKFNDKDSKVQEISTLAVIREQVDSRLL